MSYRDILKDRRLMRLAISTLAGRVAQTMFDITLVIFVVTDLQRPAAAGLAVLLATLPGLLLSPLSGAFLQGRDVTKWMTIDYLVKGVAITGISVGASSSSSGLWLLCALALSSSLTSAIGYVAMRSYISLVLAVRLRGPANGLDSSMSALADMAGPALAGVTVVALGGRMSVATVGIMFLFAAAVAFSSGRSIHKNGGGMQLDRHIKKAIGEVWKHPVLRQITGVYFSYQVAIGMLVVASPLVISSRFKLDVSWVGASWSIAGAAGIVASLLAGHMIAPNMERRLMSAGAALTMAGVAGLFFLEGVPGLIAVFVPLGIAVGLLDVGLLTLRQSVLPEAGATGTLAMSSSLNLAGYPAGAMLGGLLSEQGQNIQIGSALGFAAIALVMCRGLPHSLDRKQTADP